MIKEVIKRDGSIEPFIAKKINGWGKWSAKGFSKFIDWPEIVTKTVSQMSERVTSKQLNDGLIANCLEEDTWAGQLMAGRLFASQIHKEVFGGKEPLTIKQVHEVMQAAGVMVELDYSDDEYAKIDKLLKHKRDFDCAHYQLKQGRDKYALRNRLTGRVYETRQLALMRVAMVVCEPEDPILRMDRLRSMYEDLSCERVSAPTPNHNNMGTGHNGFFSCCLYTCEDTKESIAAANHIAEVMTYMSAGLGQNMQVRSLGDGVQNGRVIHQGKIPYFGAQTGIVKSNKQGSRGGSLNEYYSAFDPEVPDIMALKNPRTPLNKRNRSIDYTLMLNRFILWKSSLEEDIFLFNCYTAPDLYKALYGKSLEEFVEIYERYAEDDSFSKMWVSAREIVVRSREEGFETGRFFKILIDEINYHTPHRDPIVSSNLCVAPETQLLTKDGYRSIKELEGRTIAIWNGDEWSEAPVVKTGTNQKLIKVVVDEAIDLECTLYHKFYVLKNDNTVKEVRACELQIGDTLEPFRYPEQEEDTAILFTVTAIIDEGRYSDTYCVTEPKRHRAVFNGILTGQCVEITQPTEPYRHILELYSEKFLSFIRFKADNGVEYCIDGNKPVHVLGFGKVAATELKPGTTFSFEKENLEPILTTTDEENHRVVEVIESRKEPEVSLCGLAALIPTNIHSEEQYAESAYNALYMIDFCIDHNHYALPHMKLTAQARRNAGVGIMDLAHYMAKKGLKYNTEEGYKELHRVAERHAYHLINASIRLGKERGNAEWMHKTDWPRGWTPLRTYNRNVDKIANFELQYDWKAVEQDLIDNEGCRFSSLISHMPGESSSKYSAATNSLMGLRDLSIRKTDGDNAMLWVAPEADELKDQYTYMYDLTFRETVNFYAIFYKLADQSISTDFYVDINAGEKVNSTDLLEEDNYWADMGCKSWYYTVINSSNKEALSGVMERKNVVTEDDDDGLDLTGPVCTSGGCTL